MSGKIPKPNVVLMEPRKAQTTSDIITTIADHLSVHMCRNFPDDEGLKKVLSQPGWVVGTHLGCSELEWHCGKCGKKTLRKDAVWATKPCKGVDPESFFAHLRKTRYDTEKVEDKYWNEVLERISGQEQNIEVIAKQESK